MTAHTIANPSDWAAARTALLTAEKAHTRAADDLARARRELPWLKIETDYRFDGPDGAMSLADLFGPHGQLVIYHFMFAPGWAEGCTSCSFFADNMNGIEPHMAARDTALVMVSAAPYPTLAAYRARMGWTLPWVSEGAEGAFGRDMGVRFSPDQLASGAKIYNFATSGFPVSEAPGISCFTRDEAGAVFLTYQTFARGLEAANGAFRMMDLTAKGRDEGDAPMGWLRRRDQY